MKTDDLAKLLFQYLLAGDCQISELRRLGWFEFLRFDLPDTDDARRLAATALHRLLIGDSGAEINHDGRIVYATLAFVRAVRGGAPPTDVSLNLQRILGAPPVEEAALAEWFTATFP